MFITAIIEIVYYNGQNKKSPWARSLNYAGNEYENEYVFFQLLKNDGNDILTICAILQRLRTYGVMMETVVEFWYNKTNIKLEKMISTCCAYQKRSNRKRESLTLPQSKLLFKRWQLRKKDLKNGKTRSYYTSTHST